MTADHSPTTTASRHEHLLRALTPTRRYADTEVARMLAAAADLFDQRGEHDHAERLRQRAAELEHATPDGA